MLLPEDCSSGAESARSAAGRICVIVLLHASSHSAPHFDWADACSWSLAAFQGRPQPVHRNEPPPTPGLLRMSYLTLPLCARALSAAAVFALAAAAVMAEGSANATTASPGSKL
jgi:hypothetical protein